MCYIYFMRPIVHTPTEDMTVEGVLYALSDPVRAQILLEMVAAVCPQKCADFGRVLSKPLPKSTLSQHFRILREAGLIHSERKGKEIHNTLRCDEMTEPFVDLITKILDSYAKQMKACGGRKKGKGAA